MTEEEIRNRIAICEERRIGYLEADKPLIAEKYADEIYKWENLLSLIDYKREEDLKTYHQGYEFLKKKLDTIYDLLTSKMVLDNQIVNEIINLSKPIEDSINQINVENLIVDNSENYEI